MTSLIDVIFLLLLFFMLSSTFSRFSEVELVSGGAGASPPASPPLFLRISAEEISLNATQVTLEGLGAAIRARAAAATGAGTMPVLVSVRGDVSAQRLTNLLVALRPVEGIAVAVLTPR